MASHRGGGERRLVDAHNSGDPDAFAAIVRAHYGSLLGHAHRRLLDRHAAEDAVQETLLRAYDALPRFNGEYRLSSWLHRILENVCIDEANRRRRELAAGERAADRSVEEAEPDVATRLRAPDPNLVRALARLPRSQCEALLLRYVHDLSYRDVAAKAGISEENARARVHRARSALRRLLALLVAPLAWTVRSIRRSEPALAQALLAPPEGVSAVVARAPQVVTQAAAMAPDRLAVATKVATLVVAVSMPVATVAMPRPAGPPPALAAPLEAIDADLGAGATELDEVGADPDLPEAVAAHATPEETLGSGSGSAAERPSATEARPAGDTAATPQSTGGDAEGGETQEPSGEPGVIPAGELSRRWWPVSALAWTGGVITADDLRPNVRGDILQLGGPARLVGLGTPVPRGVLSAVMPTMGDHDATPPGWMSATFRAAPGASRSAPQLAFSGTLVEVVSSADGQRLEFGGTFTAARAGGSRASRAPSGRFSATYVASGEHWSLVMRLVTTRAAEWGRAAGPPRQEPEPARSEDGSTEASTTGAEDAPATDSSSTAASDGENEEAPKQGDRVTSA